VNFLRGFLRIHSLQINAPSSIGAAQIAPEECLLRLLRFFAVNYKILGGAAASGGPPLTLIAPVK
jgi:hypothetical protein